MSEAHIEVSGEKSGTARELDPPEGRVTRLVELFDAVRSAVKGKRASRASPAAEEDRQK